MIQVDLKSRTPIYEQLYENIRELILIGALVEDEKIPSVRELASTLTINPNTIQKAFSKLESDGYIYVVRGRGNFVKGIEADKLAIEAIAIREKLKDIIREARMIGLDHKALIDMVKECLEEESK